MNKICAFKFTLPIIAFVCLLYQDNLAQTRSEWTRRLGSEKRTAFIDIYHLKSAAKKTGYGISDFLSSDLEKKSL